MPRLNIFGTVLVIASTSVVVAKFLVFVSDTAWFQFPLGGISAYGASMLLILIARHIAHLSLPCWYWKIRVFEDEGRLYSRFGVEAFKKLLVLFGFDVCNWQVRFSGHRSGLRNLSQGMRQAEHNHVISFLVLLFTLIYALARNWYAVTGWLAAVNVIANVYPVMLQRHNRARVEPLLEMVR
jgi:Glycosyl-4,4'-diaponeurosporenoate acyltransferase